jgi:hypothetical protein
VKILGLRKIGINILFRLFDNTVDIYVKEHLLFSLANSLEDPRREQFLNAQLRSPNQDIAMIAAYLLTSNNLKLAKSSVPVNTWASPILKSKRLLRNRVIGDRVGDIIKKRYGVSIPVSFSFRHILSRGQYKQIMLHLNMAEGSFATNRSLWVVQMDNINQIFLTLIYRKLCIPVPMGQEFGAIKSSSLGTSFPNLAAIFERCHDASRENPVPHAYSRLLGNFSRNIKVRRRDNLVRELKTAYQEFINKY